MLDGQSVAAVIDGSFESLLNVVYRYYYEKFIPSEIVLLDHFQQSFGTTYVIVETDEEKSNRVLASMRKKFSHQSLSYVYNVSLSADEEKYMVMFQYIVAAFKIGKEIDRYEQYDFVLQMHKLSKSVSNEAHRLQEFVRFAKTKEGILYADISPIHFVLPILAEAFSDRLISERFVIHDVGRKVAVIYDTNECVFVETPENAAFDFYDDEKYYQKLWFSFYQSIAIKERKNLKLQMQHMPKRFWKHMTEHRQRGNEQ